MGILKQFGERIGHSIYGFGFKRDPGVHGENGLYPNFDQHPAAMMGAAVLPAMTNNAKFAPPVWDQGQTGCHDDKTEVLTSAGWKRWEDYSAEDLLGTVNPVTMELEFQTPSALQRFEYKGPLHKVDHNSLDFALTPNHRMFQRRWSQEARTLSCEFSFRTIADIGWYSGLLAAPSGYQGTELDRLTIGKRTYTGDDLMALLGLIISDGWTGGTEHTHNRVSYCCYREDRIEMVTEFSARMGLHPLPGRPNVWMWSDPELAAWLKANAYNGEGFLSPHKRLPDLVKCASQRQIEHFLRFYGDQHVNRETGQQSFYTSSRCVANDLQELHLRIGKRTGLQERAPKDVTMADGRRIVAENCNTAFALNVWKTDLLSIERKRQMYTEEYAGTVFCATVPNSTIITRRNGTVLISGNSCTGHGTAGMVTTTLAAHGKPLSSPILPRVVYCLGRAIDRTNPDTPLQDQGAQPNSVARALGVWGCELESDDDGGRTASSPDYSSYLEAHINDEPKLGELETAGNRTLVGFNAIGDTDPNKLVQFQQALATGHCVGIAADAGVDAFQGYDPSAGPLDFTGTDPDHWIFIEDYGTVAALRAAGRIPSSWTGLAPTVLLFLLQNSWNTGWGTAGKAWVTEAFIQQGAFNSLVANLGC